MEQCLWRDSGCTCIIFLKSISSGNFAASTTVFGVIDLLLLCNDRAAAEKKQAPDRRNAYFNRDRKNNNRLRFRNGIGHDLADNSRVVKKIRPLRGKEALAPHRQSQSGERNVRFSREVAMNQLNPTKEQVREYLARRQAEHEPPPTLNEIRKQLGWNLPAADVNATDIQWTSWDIILFPPTLFFAHYGRILAVTSPTCDKQ